MDSLPGSPKKTRRYHSPEFKARVVALCQEPNVSRAAVARRFDLNDNLVHKWCVDARKNMLPAAKPDFVKLPTVPAPSNSGPMITIEYTTANGHLKVQWPLTAIDQCAPWLKALGL